MNKKLKARVALVCATASIVINTMTATAAPYIYSSGEDVRSKALSKYFSTAAVVAMVEKEAPAFTSEVKEIMADGVLVAYNTEKVSESVSYNTVKRSNASLKAGETQTVREGTEGEKIVSYRVKYENGKEISREVISESVIKAPVDRIVEYGATKFVPGASADTGFIDYKYVIECEATAYDLSPEENGGYAGQSATGVPLDKGVIAVDPRVIPLGSRVYVEALDGSWSYGFAVAADTGGAIKGNRVDLCYRTQYECIQFGRRKCRVYVLN